MKEIHPRALVSFILIQLGIIYLVFVYPSLIRTDHESLEVLAQVGGYFTLGFLFYDLWSKKGGTSRLLELGLEYNPVVVSVFLILILAIAFLDGLSVLASLSLTLTKGANIIFLFYVIVLSLKVIRLKKSKVKEYPAGASQETNAQATNRI